MKMLVTGATGRVGSRAVPRLAAWGESVRVLVRDELRALPFREAGLDVHVGDLRDPRTREACVAGVDVVLHIAATFRGAAPEEVAEVNASATRELARAAQAAGVRRFVFTSTGLVYGTGGNRPAREADALPGSIPPYPASKAAAEAELLALHGTAGFDVRVARLGFVYGDGDPHLQESLLWARRWPPHKRLHMVHHADVAAALRALVRTSGLDGWVFNLADDAPLTAAELHDLNREVMRAENAEIELAHPWEGIMDVSKARDELGFRPIYPTVYSARAAGAL